MQSIFCWDSRNLTVTWIRNSTFSVEFIRTSQRSRDDIIGSTDKRGKLIIYTYCSKIGVFLCRFALEYKCQLLQAQSFISLSTDWQETQLALICFKVKISGNKRSLIIILAYVRMEGLLRKRKRRVQMTKKRVATYTSFAIILVFPAAVWLLTSYAWRWSEKFHYKAFLLHVTILLYFLMLFFLQDGRC